MSKSSSNHESAEQHVKSIRRATRKQYSAEEKIREGVTETFEQALNASGLDCTTVRAWTSTSVGQRL